MVKEQTASFLYKSMLSVGSSNCDHASTKVVNILWSIGTVKFTEAQNQCKNNYVKGVITN